MLRFWRGNRPKHRGRRYPVKWRLWELGDAGRERLCPSEFFSSKIMPGRAICSAFVPLRDRHPFAHACTPIEIKRSTLNQMDIMRI